MKAILLTLLAFTGTAALANEAADELANRTPFVSTLSRQAVQQDYLDARRDGTLPDTSEAASLDVLSVPVNQAARIEARRQARQAAREHVVHELM